MSANFVKNFNCKNEKHVLWLRDVGHEMAKATAGEKVDIEKTINTNPIDGSPRLENMIDWAYTHFQLAMKYSNAVLNGEAFVPSS